MVPLSKSGVRKHRGFESRPLRHLAGARHRFAGNRSGFETLGSHHSPVTARKLRPGPWDRDVRGSTERSPSGLWRRTGNAVRGNPSGVRIPPSPPLFASNWQAPRGSGLASRYTLACRARRGTSGALYLQSAPAGLNPLPRSPFSDAARRVTLRTGSRASANREPCQVRKEAALSDHRRVPRYGLVRAARHVGTGSFWSTEGARQ